MIRTKYNTYYGTEVMLVKSVNSDYNKKKKKKRKDCLHMVGTNRDEARVHM